MADRARTTRAEKANRITFDLAEEEARAIEALAGERRVRLSGEMRDGKVVIDSVSFAEKDFSRASFVPVNAPFATTRS